MVSAVPLGPLLALQGALETLRISWGPKETPVFGKNLDHLKLGPLRIRTIQILGPSGMRFWDPCEYLNIMPMQYIQYSIKNFTTSSQQFRVRILFFNQAHRLRQIDTHLAYFVLCRTIVQQKIVLKKVDILIPDFHISFVLLRTGSA